MTTPTDYIEKNNGLLIETSIVELLRSPCFVLIFYQKRHASPMPEETGGIKSLLINAPSLA